MGILEGGYSPSLLAEASINVVHALLGRAPPPQKFPSPSAMAKLAKTGGGPGGDIKASWILNAVRRHLNTLPPWNAMKSSGSQNYFHEDPNDSGKDSAATLCTLIDQ